MLLGLWVDLVFYQFKKFLMGNFKRMHVIGGSVALICLILQVPNYWKVMDENFLNGLKFAAELAIGSYLLGCVLGLSVNLIMIFFQK